MSSFDKLTIETPEQTQLEFPLAGIGSRFLAIALDSIIQTLAYIVLGLLALFLFGGQLAHVWRAAWNWSQAIFILVMFCMYWGYYAIFETLWNGQTPGKRLAGIRVIKETGRPIAVFEAVSRNLVRVIDQIPGVYAVGCITMFLNKKSKRLGDFVAGTVVVHEKKEDAAEPFFNLQAATPIPAYQVSKLSLIELELIETFLARRLDIPPEVRVATARRIAERISQKLGCERPPSDDEDFLEVVAKQCRDSLLYR